MESSLPFSDPLLPTTFPHTAPVIQARYKWTPHQIFPTKHRSWFALGYFIEEKAKNYSSIISRLTSDFKNHSNLWNFITCGSWCCCWWWCEIIEDLNIGWKLIKSIEGLEFFYAHNWCGCESIYFWWCEII